MPYKKLNLKTGDELNEAVFKQIDNNFENIYNSLLDMINALSERVTELENNGGGGGGTTPDPEPEVNTTITDDGSGNITVSSNITDDNLGNVTLSSTISDDGNGNIILN